MAVNIERTLSPFTDLDDVFEPRISGDPVAAATGISPVGSTTDLNQRYCPLSMGSAIATNTGIQRIGSTTDLRSIFAGLGTVSRLEAPWAGRGYIASENCNNATGSCATTTTWSLRFNESGVVEVANGGAFNSIGEWITNPNFTASDYEVLVDGDGIILNEYSSWTTISTALQLRSQLTLGATPDNSTTSPPYEIFIQLREKANTSNIVSGTVNVRHRTTNIGIS